MKNWIAVSCYTINTSYEKHAKNLFESAAKYGVDIDIEPFESLGTWLKNIQYKAEFIKKMMIKHYPKNIVFVDADGIFCAYPELFDALDSVDCAAFLYKDIELASGTLFFKNNIAGQNLVARWILKNMECPKDLDQANLHAAIRDLAPRGLRYKNLPASYCVIFDLMKDVLDPVIKHFQASRSGRAEIAAYHGKKQ